MLPQLQQTQPTQDQQAHDRQAQQNLRQSVQRIVLEETQGARRIIQAVVSIMEGDAPNSTPWHQLEAAKLLLKLGFNDAQPKTQKSPSPSTDEGYQTTPSPLTAEGNPNIPSPLTAEGHLTTPSPLTGEGRDGGEIAGGENPAHPVTDPERIKLNKKLVRQIRIDTYDGASTVKFLIDVMEGNEPDAKVRDRIEAAKILLHLCFDNPFQPDPEFMMREAPCHPDCLCVCKDMPEDHPEVVRAHTPLTAEQRAEHQRQAEFNDKAADTAKRKAEMQREWQLEQTYSPVAVDARRLEREERRKRRERKQEREAEREQEREQARRQKPEVVRRSPTEQEVIDARIQAHKRGVERDKQRWQATLRRERAQNRSP